MSSDISVENHEAGPSRRDAPRFLGDGLDDEDDDNIDALFENLDDADEFALPAPVSRCYVLPKEPTNTMILRPICIWIDRS